MFRKEKSPLPSKLLVISSNPKDHIFAQELGREIEREIQVTNSAASIEQTLIDEPQTIVLLEADDLAVFRQHAKMIYGRVSRSRVFIVTNNPLNEYPGLFEVQIFGHHLRRRFSPPAARVIGKIMLASVSPNPFGIERYFSPDDDVRVQKIDLNLSSKKTPAVEAVRNFLSKTGTADRLASKVAQAADELLMNAIYDAPVLKDGTHYRHGVSRQSSFDIDGGVTLSFAEAETYAAISVMDAFGSVDREKIMFCLKKDYREANYIVRPSAQGVGLGLSSIILSDLSIQIITRPKMKTEAVLFFPKVSKFKDIRTSFNFFGVIGL